ncbi:MAG: glycosyltransferase [Proteobacteria bacterium]|nr:glycosyltransferase [Pseudomonadota bacterium]
MKSLRVVYIITGLGTGGAEMSLLRLLSALDRDKFDPYVISLANAGPLGEKIHQLGVPVRQLGMDTRCPNPFLLVKLFAWLRQIRPDVIQTWMYHADLLGGLAGFLAGLPVVWGIHNTSLDPSAVKSGTIRVVRINAWLSGWLPHCIISCSEEARRAHVRMGYASDKFVVIPNGFDLNTFRPDSSARDSLRRELSLTPNMFLVGLVARFDPLKDHQTFIRAADIFHKTHPQAQFVLCGDGISWSNEVLSGWIDAVGIRQNCHLLGRRDDIPHLMSAFDVNTLSSIGEAFPNVLGEAMACGVPCVTTDVGDAAEIVGDTGIVVPPRDAHALAEGWERLINLSTQERYALGQRARARIQTHYQIGEVVLRYQQLYRQLVQR